MKRLTRQLTIPLALCLPALLAPAAWAQIKTLDKHTLIDGLRREGMSELMLRLVETEPLDPIEAKEIEASQQLLRAQNVKLPREERIKAMDRAMDLDRALIQQNAGSAQRPMWQVDLVELLLSEYIPLKATWAAEFYEFGVPTGAQKQAFEAVAAEALTQSADADIRFGALQSELSRNQKEWTDKYVNTGLKARMFDDYYNSRTQYYLAQAAYYTALLPADHPYYGPASLGKPPRKATYDEERYRLAGLCIERAQPFLRKVDASGGLLKALAQGLIARATLQQAIIRQEQIERKTDPAKLVKEVKLDAALAELDKVIRASKGDLNDLLAHLAKAKALALQGKAAESQSELDACAVHQVVRAAVVYRLLVADLDYNLRQARAKGLPADQQTAALAEAYQVYDRLFTDPTLTPEVREAFKGYIATRWEANIDPKQDLSKLSVTVLAGLVESAAIAGKDLYNQALEAGNQKKAEEAKQLQEQSRAKVARALKAADALLKLDKLPPEIKARGRYYQALAVYFSDPDDLGNLLKSTDLWIKLAEDMPDQKIAESGLGDAAALLRLYHERQPRPQGVSEMFERAMKLLLAPQFDTSKAADHNRTYYAFAVLEPAGKYDEAAAQYLKVPPGHLLYYDARREMLYCYKHMSDAARPELKAPARQRVVEAATKLQKECEADLPKPDPDGGIVAKTEQQARVLDTLGNCKLVLADMAMEQSPPDFNTALALLDKFEADYAGNNDLIRDAMQRRILALVSAGRLDQAASTASAMMARYADAAARVIEGLLANIEDQADKLRRQAEFVPVQVDKKRLLDQAEKLYAAGETFSRMFIKWAEDNRKDEPGMLPYRVGLARSLRLAGKAQEALDYLKPLYEKNPNNADIIHNLAEGQFTLGTPESLAEATKLYKLLARSLRQGDDRKYPAIWWNAWMRQLQLAERDATAKKDKKALADVGNAVRQLQLVDPNLGGDPYKSEFERLLRKAELEGGGANKGK